MSIAAPVLHYTPPTWACDPPAESGYKLEIVKNGTIVDTINLETRKHGTFVLIGRLPNCDLMLGNLSSFVLEIQKSVYLFQNTPRCLATTPFCSTVKT